MRHTEPTRTSLCHICKQIATHTCRLCGRPVCNEHFDSLTEVCDSCRRGKIQGS